MKDAKKLSVSNTAVDESAAGYEVAAPHKMKCCGAFFYDGHPDATGYNFNIIGRGFLIIANLMLNQSLLWLASNEAGCFEDSDGDGEPDIELGACDKRVYGMLPSSFIANIATFSGIGAALLLPLTGAYIDFTPHRKRWGIWSAAIMTLIQFTQIFTIQKTWLAMLVLQIFAIISYQVQNMLAFSYEPEIFRDVGEEAMGRFTAHFVSNQFGAQCVFLLVIAVIQFTLEPSAVTTAQISQGLNTVTCIVFFGICWFKYFTPRPAKRELPANTNIVAAGLRQNLETVKNMNKYFKRGLRWYFLAVTFARAAGSAITTLSVIYLQDSLKLGPMAISIFFFCTMIGCLPGPHLGLLVTKRWDPKISYMGSNIFLVTVLIAGVFILEGIPRYCAYIWGFFMGISLGWFYSTENLFFSLCLPHGQEAELSGFFVCCTNILVWLPPLLFVIVIENDVAQKFGWLPMAAFLLIAAGLLMMAGTWEEIRQEAAEGFEAIEADKKLANAANNKDDGEEA